MKDIKAQADRSHSTKANSITGGKLVHHTAHPGYAKGGKAHGKSKTQVNVVIPQSGNTPRPVPVPIPAGPVGGMPAGGTPPLGGTAGPMRKRGGKA